MGRRATGRPTLCSALAALCAAILPLAAQAAPPACRYDIDIAPPPRLTLDIAVDCGALPVDRMVAIEESLPRYIERIEDADAHALRRRDDHWQLPETGPRLVRYRVQLGDMGAAERSYSSAYALGNSVLAEISSWALLPQPLPEDAVLHLVPHAAEGTGFATALEPREDGYDLPARAMRAVGYSVFGHFGKTRLSPPYPAALAPDAPPALRDRRAVVDLVTLDQRLDRPAEEIARWVDDTAQAVSSFWQGFPVGRLLLVLLPQPNRNSIPYGRVIAGGGASLMVMVGEHADRATLYGDWVLIHEMVHLGSPFVGRSPWMTEGFATYFEPLIRFRAGRRNEESLWAEFARDMPRGAETLAREGLAYTRRGIYWGGALFMLLADMDIRERSHGGRGLEDCLRHILHQGGDATRFVNADWMIEACDRAVGGDTVRRLAQRYAWSRGEVDLDEVWRRLGVIREPDGQVRLNDAAPLAWVRRALSAGKSDPG